MGQMGMLATLNFRGNSLSKDTIREVTVLTHKLTSKASNRLHPHSYYCIRGVAPYISFLSLPYRKAAVMSI